MPTHYVPEEAGGHEVSREEEKKSAMVLEWRYCSGDQTWYTLNESLAWAVSYFGAEKDARHCWESTMKPTHVQERRYWIGDKTWYRLNEYFWHGR